MGSSAPGMKAQVCLWQYSAENAQAFDLDLHWDHVKCFFPYVQDGKAIALFADGIVCPGVSGSRSLPHRRLRCARGIGAVLQLIIVRLFRLFSINETPGN